MLSHSSHLPPSEEVEMKVKHDLAPLSIAVCQDPVPLFRNSPFPGEPGRREENSAQESALILTGLVKGSQMPSWNEKDMDRGLRIDVLKSHDLIILIDQLGGDFPGGDFAEDAIGHG